MTTKTKSEQLIKQIETKKGKFGLNFSKFMSLFVPFGDSKSVKEGRKRRPATHKKRTKHDHYQDPLLHPYRHPDKAPAQG
jgi:hypothetical protein